MNLQFNKHPHAFYIQGMVHLRWNLLLSQQVRLKKNDSCIIPAHKSHSLLLETEFKSLVIMALDSDIEFVK